MVAALLVIAACGDSDDDATPSNAASDRGEVAYAEEQLAQYDGPAEFTPPGDTLEDVESLAGQTVFWIPISAQIRGQALVEEGLRDAFDEVGVNVQTCDAQVSPSEATACVNRALDTGASGIIPAFPPVLAQNPLDIAVERGVPVLQAMAVPYSQAPAPTNELATLGLHGDVQFALIADWIIADSDAQANVLVQHVIDAPVTDDAVVNGAVPEFDEHCPECQVEVVELRVTDVPQISQIVSTELVQHPEIDYIVAMNDAWVPGTIEGLGIAGRNDIKVVTQGGLLDSMQRLSEGGIEFIAGQTLYGAGWIAADQMMRMMLGVDVVEEPAVPIRLFTPESIDDLDLTPAAEASSAWFDFDVATIFREHWGLS